MVRGRVQGVSFRDATARRARSLGVAGEVRNRGDGSVEAVFEGPAEAVEAMLRFCRSGPRLAQVEAVDVEEEAPRGASGFAIA